MANPNPLPSFSDFPEDVQLCILSFLAPNDIATFACTSKRFVSLCNSDSRLWFTMCERKWGSKTKIRKWVKEGAITYKQVYRTLSEWENLIGFWRRSGQGSAAISSPSLLFFEWGDSFVSGFRVSPSSKRGSYEVVKSPFLWMGLSSDGQVVNFLDPDGRAEFLPPPEFAANGEVGLPDSELIPVNVSFMGSTHFVLEENQSFSAASSSNCSNDQRKNGFRRSSSSANLSGDECGVVGEDVSGSPGSLPDRLMSEIYQHLANRTSPGSDKSRKQRRRREKERLARRKWEPEHFVKIVNCSPTLSRPLQGLWKGICDDMSLAFYLVAYDDIGGIACRRVGDPPEHLSSYAPVFWTSKAIFLESPFTLEEETLYGSRLHLRPIQQDDEIQEQFPLSDDELGNQVQQFHLSDNEVVKRILHISSSYDLVIPDMAGAINPRSAEGRIWQYQNGTFGFGFIRDNFVIDMKHIVHDGCLVDTVNP